MTDQPPPSCSTFNTEAASSANEEHRYPNPKREPAIKMLETELTLPRELRAQKALKHPRLAAELLHAMIGTMDREHFVAFYLDSKRVVTHAHIVSRGTVQTTLVHPREVFKWAVLANAASVIVGHNHPSGEVAPSPEDLAAFERLTAAGETLGIRVIDALIVGPCDKFHSTLVGCQGSPGKVHPSSAKLVHPIGPRKACYPPGKPLESCLAGQLLRPWKIRPSVRPSWSTTRIIRRAGSERSCLQS